MAFLVAVLMLMFGVVDAEAATNWYLHGTGDKDKAKNLFLSPSAPAGTTPKYEDATGVHFPGGNPWKEIGVWAAAAAASSQSLISAGNVAVWVGLKNSDDQGTSFDIRAELYKNTTLISSGQILCVTGLTRNPGLARAVSFPLGPVINGLILGGDILSIRLLARIGTYPDGNRCDGHSNAEGLRLYFDAVSRPSSVDLSTDATPPVITPSVSPQPNANGWNNTNVTITFTCSDAQSGVASCPPPVTVNSEGAGQVITRNATDNAGNTATSTVTLNIDKTAPIITAATTPAADANGWNGTDVTITFTCADAGSGVPNCPPPVTVSSEGPSQQISGTATDRAGNSATAIVSVSIDKTAPGITAGTNPAANSTGWNNTDVTVTFNCSDTGSGVSNCPSPVTVSSEGNNQQISGTATDRAGKTATASVTLNIDKTAPGITAEASPAPNSNGWNKTDVTVTFSCSDAGSGIVNCPPPVTVSTEGASQQTAASVTDRAGNSATASVTASIDKTAPTITPTANPPADANGWNNTNVAVSFTCSDAGSGVVSCPSPITLTSDGANQQVSGSVADRAGNTAAASITLNISTSLPNITAAASPQPNTSGWNNTSVTVTFTCSDAIGIASCSAPVTLSTEGANQVVTGSATNQAGLTRTASLTLNIDKTAPTVAITSPANGITVSATSITVTGTAADAGSGLGPVTCNGSPASVTGSTFSCQVPLSAGSNLITVQASDLGGNQQSASVSVNLVTVEPAISGNVLWTNLAGVSASNNVLTKTGASATWNAGAASKNVIRDGYGFLEFTAAEANTMRMAGFSNGDTNQDYIDVDYGILIRNDGSLAIYEAGFYRGEFGSYQAGDRFRQEVRYGAVRYLRNGSVFFTSPTPPRFPLSVDTTFNTPGAKLSNFQVGNYVWTNGAGVSISGSGLAKTGTAGWNAGAISTNTIETGDGFAEFTATETNTLRIVGLANGDTSQSFEDVEFGIQLRNDSAVEVVESGASRGQFGIYLAGDRFRVELSGGVVRYLRNGTVFYTSTIVPTYPLRVDSSLYTPGATLADVNLETLIWTNTLGVSVYGSGLAKTDSDGWNAAASSVNTFLSSDGWLEFTAIETDSRRILGLKSGSAAQSYADIDFAIELQATGTIQVLERGAVRGQFGSYGHGDRLRIEIQDGVVRYLKNSSVLYTSLVEPVYPLHAEAALYTNGSTIADAAVGELVWSNAVGIQISGNSFAKTGTSALWDSGAVSTKAINSGYLEFTASGNTAYRIVGLSHGDSNQDYTDIDYSILIRSDGSVAIYEAGVYRGEFGTYVSGDRFRVELQSGPAVKYYENGMLFYSSTVVPTLPLRVDATVLTTRGTVFNAVLVGSPILDQLDLPTITPGTGNYSSTQSVTLTHPIGGTTIRYTLDGTDPTQSSPAYTAPIVVDGTLTLKAKAWKPGYLPSGIRSATYTMKVATPAISVATGTYNTARTVTITTTTTNATIRYTTDGSNPTSSSPVYSSALTVDESLTLKTIASKTGWTDSSLASAVYTMKVGALNLTPTFGSHSAVQTVTFSSVTPNVTFRYTVDGTEPGVASPAVTGNSIVLDRSVTLKAQGFRTGWTSSDIIRGNYFINIGTAATPVLSPNAGTYTSQRTVAISTATPTATIRYTTDGTDPNITSKIYTGPILVFNSTEIRAKAYKSDYTASATAAGLYVIDSGAVDTPRLSPGSGVYPTSQTVTVTTQTAGVMIHYTINGADPTESDPTVASGGTLTVDRSMTLKLKAWKTGLPPSAVGKGDYQITGAIGAGQRHSLAVKADGTVWSWGSDQYGATGRPPDGAMQTTPGQVTITNVVAVAGGGDFSLALKKDGTVWSWGYGYQGQLGGGSSSVGIRWAPGPVLNLTNVVSIAAGIYYGIAVKSDGTVWMWGNMNGINYGSTPVQIPGLKGVVQVAAGDFSVVALKTDGDRGGTVWAWGDNNWSELGDGTSTDRSEPIMAVGISDVTAIGSGTDHTLAARSDGTIWAWGRNAWGQLGNGTYDYVVPLPTLASFTPVLPGPAAPIAGGGQFSLVLQRSSMRSERRILAAGLNSSGQLGTGSVTSSEATPMFNLMTGAVAVAASGIGSHGLAIHVDGSVWSWGYNGDGQLGSGTTVNRSTPAPIAGFVLADNTWMIGDADADGLSNGIEMELGTDPTSSDTNGDGIPDNVSSDAGVDPANPDVDFDGLTNTREREIGTDPFRPDTDGDGVNDGPDCFPLESARSQCPAPTPGDGTPPSIILQEPTNAILVGSTP